MERPQAAQEEKLVGMIMEKDSLEGIHYQRDSSEGRSHCFKCVVALVAVMGLITVALVLGFIFHYFIFMASEKQDPAQLRAAGKVSLTCKLKKMDENGTYEIVTVAKGAKYLIYGWLKLINITSEDVIVRQALNEDKRTIEKKKSNKMVFFFNEVLLADSTTISVYFNASCTDNLFHVLEV